MNCCLILGCDRESVSSGEVRVVDSDGRKRNDILYLCTSEIMQALLPSCDLACSSPTRLLDNQDFPTTKS
jgi:hypothetical protein